MSSSQPNRVIKQHQPASDWTPIDRTPVPGCAFADRSRSRTSPSRGCTPRRETSQTSKLQVVNSTWIAIPLGPEGSTSQSTPLPSPLPSSCTWAIRGSGRPWRHGLSSLRAPSRPRTRSQQGRSPPPDSRAPWGEGWPSEPSTQMKDGHSTQWIGRRDRKGQRDAEGDGH